MQTQRGFTYLGVLFFVAITTAALASLGQAWSTAAQRERERELAFRGGEIARAIRSYLKASPSEPALYPRKLDDLLADRRGAVVIHHLRRPYVDPMTGLADWVLVAEAGDSNGFGAVHSRSEQVLLRQLSEDGQSIGKASDWRFSASALELRGVPTAARTASAPRP